MDKCAHPLVDTQTTLPSCEFEDFPIIDKCGSRADVLYGLLRFIEPRREVAVKAFRCGLKSVSTLAVENEIRIWRLLGFHPHIASFLAIAPVNVYDEKYSAKGVVSEYCAQGNAWVYLNKSDPDVTNHSLRFQLLKDVIRGLTHIHAQSIVHGDLKAFNVLIDGNDNTQVARICDFGSSSISCACYSGPQEQEGTLPWDSPELWVPGEDDDDDDRVPSRTERSDIWAFGCVALEIQMGLTPWDPFDMRNAEAMKRRQFNAGTGPPAMFSDPNLGLEAHQVKLQVWNLMVKCWGASPQQRPTAAELLKEMLGMNLIAT
ncbi:unnamed protein product [Rhizoctonia solani]|uniref:Protein kinase domain-containing protein n=1 Tax=Rhizoctonia solani TaxID=456999 RepID=A0A8H3BJW5_9AGAM|nr:unnamed protein product [Rhizoctonia solani]